MNLSYEHKRYPVEYLIFQLEDPKMIDRFIELDHTIWTAYLESNPGFIAKEVWVNEENPGELHTVVIWETMEQWKVIPLEELKATTKKFDQAFGSPYKITRRLHKEYNHGLYKVRHYEKDGK